MGSDTDKPLIARTQRSYKIWGLVGVLVLIVTFTHLVFPSSAPTPPSHYFSNKHLKAHNYFNASSSSQGDGSALPNPFSFCNGQSSSTKYTPLTLSKTILHTGTTARLKRTLHLALSGQPITISVLGGSISACHGSGDDPISPLCYPSKIFTWWNEIFPNPGSELTNGAMRKTNSDYFGYCSRNHLPDAPDLVIIELDTSDEPGSASLLSYELLLRNVLSLPSQPAVLLLSHFSPQTHLTHGFLGAAHYHLGAAHFYDTPHLSIAPIIEPLWRANRDKVMHKTEGYYTDMVLSNERGHEVMSDVVRHFIEQTVCEVWEEAGEEIEEGGVADKAGLFAGLGHRKGVPAEREREAKPNPQAQAPPDSLDDDAAQDPAHPILPINAPAQKPRLRKPSHDLSALSIPPNLMSSGSVPGASSRPFEEPSPFCVSANDLVNPLPPSLFYGSGWSVFHPSSAKDSANAGLKAGDGPAGHYFHSTLPLSKLRVPIQTGAGDVGIYYMQEPLEVDGNGIDKEGSQVECWVDDNYAGAKVVDNTLREGVEGRAVLQMIDHFVSRGSHFVECQLLGEEGVRVRPFKIVGVFAT